MELGSMSDILLAMIHDRATANKPDVEIIAANYYLWVAHWFMTAEDLALEFANEGLIKTHDAIKDIIEEQRKFIK
jgi:hypothetical protein